MKQNHFFQNIAKYSIAILAISMFGFIACKKVKELPPEEIIKFSNTTEVMASVNGLVLDESGSPLANAKVQIGNHSFTTDVNGVFIFSKINTKQHATKITVTKSGYFTAYRTMSILKNTDNFTRIRVMKMDNPQDFSSALTANIIAQGGAKIAIPANSIVSAATNAAFNGVVKINAKTIKADDLNIAELTPGALRGIATSGAENVLETYGMLAVEMTDASGNALQIAPGKTAEIKMPIPAAQLANAPIEIALWHFDELQGMWVEEGKALKIGNEYVGQVAHFSYWNCDYGGPIVNFDANFIDSTSGLPITNMQVKITSAVTNSARSSWTNASGAVTGQLPQNSSFTLELINQCGVIYTTTFVSTTTAINLGTLVVNIPAIYSATTTGAVVDCNGIAIPGATIILSSVGNAVQILTADATGNFSAVTTACTFPVNYTFTAYDNVNNVNGSVVTSLNAGANPIGNVAACGTQNQFFNYTITDTGVHTFTNVEPSASFTSSFFAPYTYLGSSQSISGGGGTNSYQSGSLSFGGAGATGMQDIYSFEHYNNLNNFYYTCTSDSMSGTPIGVQVNITAYSPIIGGFIEGNYTGSFTNTTMTPNTTYTITGSFRNKRTW